MFRKIDVGIANLTTLISVLEELALTIPVAKRLTMLFEEDTADIILGNLQKFLRLAKTK